MSSQGAALIFKTVAEHDLGLSRLLKAWLLFNSDSKDFQQIIYCQLRLSFPTVRIRGYAFFQAGKFVSHVLASLGKM